MTNIITLLEEIVNSSDRTMLRRMALVMQAMLAMSGRVTMLGISRRTEKGGSYRTIQWFFNPKIDWPTLFYRFFQKHHFRAEATYILAGDENVITKDRINFGVIPLNLCATFWCNSPPICKREG